MQRFAQHLKDAHGGRNAPQLQPAARPPSGGHGPPPSLRAAVQLGDLLLRALPAGGSPAPRPGTRPGGRAGQRQQHPEQPLQGAQHQQQPRSRAQPPDGRAQPAAATPPAGGPSAGHKAATAALEPPPGTRAKRGKRESRLKRAFRRSAAAQACSHWQEVLAELEAAMQAVGEAQGSLANQLAAAETDAEAGHQGGEGQGKNWAEGQPQDPRAADLAVRRQLLQQQLRHADECRGRLATAHGHARARLAAAQRQQQRVEGLLPAGGVLEVSSDGEERGAAAAGLHAVPAAGQVVPDHPAAQVEATAQQGSQQQQQQQQQEGGQLVAPPVPGSAALQPTLAVPTAHAAPPSSSSAAASEAGGSEAAASAAASSSLASFAFQDVLTSWAASSGRQQAAAVGPAPGGRQLLAGGRPSGRRGPPASHMAAAQQARGAAAAAAPRQAPALLPEARIDVPTDAAAEPSTVDSLACKGSGSASAAGSSAGSSASSGSESSESSGSGGSFGLQWGDQLRSWAGAVRLQAGAVAQHAAPAAPQAPQQQQLRQHQLTSLQLQDQQQGGKQGQQQGQQQQQQQGQQEQQLQLPPDSAQQPVAGLQAEQQQQQQQQQDASQPSSAQAQPEGTGSLAAAAASQPGAAAADEPASVSATARVVDVAAWLEAADAASATDAASAVPPSDAGVGGEMLGRRGGLAPPALVLAPLQQAPAGTAMPAFVQAAVEPPGAFRCQLCGVTISGQRNLDEHLASKRHAKHVAAAAAAAAASAAGPDATHGLALAAAVAGLPGAGSSSALSPPGGGRTYVGIGADVAPYVCQVISPELNALAEAVLRRLTEWQERVRQTDPANFRRKRRLVSGLREVEKAVKLRRAKLVLLAPNIASLEGGEGGEAAASPSQPGASACPATALAALAAEKEVPLVFALSRQRMGKLLGQRKRASAFAVLDANGVFEEVRRLEQLAEEGRRQWRAHHAALGGGAGEAPQHS